MSFLECDEKVYALKIKMYTCTQTQLMPYA